MSQEKYDKLKSNRYYTNYINYLYKNHFDEMMIQTLIIKEEGDYYGGLYFSSGSKKLYLIKRLKDGMRDEIKLIDVKDFTDLLSDLGIIDMNISYITDYIYDINSIEDIIYIINKQMDIKLFSRVRKLIKLKSNIINNLNYNIK